MYKITLYITFGPSKFWTHPKDKMHPDMKVAMWCNISIYKCEEQTSALLSHFPTMLVALGLKKAVLPLHGVTGVPLMLDICYQIEKRLCPHVSFWKNKSV